MWNVKEACGRVFLVNQHSGELMEVAPDLTMRYVVLHVQPGLENLPPAVQAPSLMDQIGIHTDLSGRTPSLYAEWSDDDRQEMVGTCVRIVGKDHYAGQVQPVDEEEKDGICNLEIKVKVGGPDWDLVHESTHKTRTQAWTAYDEWIEGRMPGIEIPVRERLNATALEV